MTALYKGGKKRGPLDFSRSGPCRGCRCCPRIYIVPRKSKLEEKKEIRKKDNPLRKKKTKEGIMKKIFRTTGS